MPMIGRHFMPNMHRAAWGFMQSGDFPVPVGYWKFGENTGEVAYDSSPEGNDGTIEGATWVKGVLGPGLSFSADDYVLIPNADSLNPADAITIAFSLDWDGTGLAEQNPLSKGVSTGVEQYEFIITKATKAIKFNVKHDDDIDSSPTYTLTAGVRVRVVGVYDGEYLRLSINGVEQGTATEATGSMADNGRNFIIGARRSNARFTNGDLDEVIMWGEGLTAAQIRQDAQGYR